MDAAAVFFFVVNSIADGINIKFYSLKYSTELFEGALFSLTLCLNIKSMTFHTICPVNIVRLCFCCMKSIACHLLEHLWND